MAGSLVAGRAEANPAPLFVSACLDSADAAAVAVFSLDGEMLFRTSLPERGHDIAIRPGSPDRMKNVSQHALPRDPVQHLRHRRTHPRPLASRQDDC